MPPSGREKRLLKEYGEMNKDSADSGISIAETDLSNLTSLQANIQGPPDTPYVGGIFKVQITIPTEYPFKPPDMKLITKIWHPNISSVTGAICLDTLSKGWSPVQTVKTALLSIRAMLETPEPTDPQDAEVGQQMIHNPYLWAQTAQQWSIQYAGAPQQELDLSKYMVEAPKREDEYKGYNKAVVDRFTEFGFSVSHVVGVFNTRGIPKHLDENALADSDLVAHLAEYVIAG